MRGREDETNKSIYLGLCLVGVLLCSQEMEEQAADLGEMYEKKYQLLHKSMKKQYSRKRRRPNDGGCCGCCGGGCKQFSFLRRENIFSIFLPPYFQMRMMLVWRSPCSHRWPPCRTE